MHFIKLLVTVFAVGLEKIYCTHNLALDNARETDNCTKNISDCIVISNSSVVLIFKDKSREAKRKLFRKNFDVKIGGKNAAILLFFSSPFKCDYGGCLLDNRFA